MARKRELKVELSGDSTGAQRALDDVGDKADKTGGRFAAFGGVAKNLAFGAMAAVGTGAAIVGKQLVDLGITMEARAAKAAVVLGDELAGVQKWAEESANALGLTDTEAVALTTNMADLLVPLGMTRKEAASMSTDLVELSGALSAWTGGSKDAAEVSEILTDALLGETDSLKQLGIDLSAADIQQRLVEKGQNDLTGAARKQAEALATQELILEKSTDAQAAFGDETKTTAERNAELKANIGELKEAIATGLQPVVIELSEWMLNEGIPALERWSNDFENGLKQIDSWADRNLKFLRDFKDWGHEMTTGNKVWRDVNAQGGEWAETAEIASEKTQELTGAQEDLAPAVEDTKKELEDFKKALDKALGVQVDITEASINHQEALADLRTAITENGVSMDLTTEKGRKMQGAFNDVIGTINDEVQALIKAGHVTEGTAAHKDELIRRLNDLKRTYPELAGPIQVYIDKVNETPFEKTTEFKVEGFPAIEAVIKEMQKPVTVPVRFDIRADLVQMDIDRAARNLTTTPAFQNAVTSAVNQYLARGGRFV